MARYVISGLGVSDPEGINSDAVIVGNMGSGGSRRGYVLRGHILTQLLGTVDGINDLDQVVGSSAEGVCVWDGGVARPLPGIEGFFEPMAINNAGMVIGGGQNSSMRVWANGEVSELPLPEGATRYGFWNVRDLNNDGEIIASGTTYHGDEGGISVRWSPKRVPRLLMPPYGYTIADAWAINDAGVVVGNVARMTDPWPDRPEMPCMWKSQTPQLLPLPPDALGGGAYDINDHGLIVGSVKFAAGRRAYAWSDGAVVDLNSLIPPGSGWALTNAEFVNNAGDIVGWGVHPDYEGQRSWHLFLDYSLPGGFELPKEILDGVGGLRRSP